mmetsp:Transcript_21243/g.24452  ORF Transcript_21243/g.24452 Transcript_21243/m.24452 type:complete len:321 (+) Transcript_21243:47-1009(+)
MADALDPFRDQAKKDNLSAASARALVHQILGNPRIYSGFVEIRSMPSIEKALSGSNINEAALRTLDLFAFGTYADYKKEEGSETYLVLTDMQTKKLKHLSIVTLVQKYADSNRNSNINRQQDTEGRRNTVPYSALRREAGILKQNGNKGYCSALRLLEDMLIECIYAGVISGKLDQRNMCFVVVPETGSGVVNSIGGSISRDVKPESIPNMILKLEQWEWKSQTLLDSMSFVSKNVLEDRSRNENRWKMVAKKIANLNDRLNETAGNTGDFRGNSTTAASVAAGMMEMDFGGIDHYSRDRKSKRSRGGLNPERGGFHRNN